MTIRPRLFLEGNFFLDLQPGSPNAPDIPDGGSIPITHTQIAVQLDQVLTTLQQPDRRNLSQLLEGYGSALYDKPTPQQDKGQDPDVVGKSAAQALNESFRYGGTAGKTSSQVSEALLGEHPDDLSGLINATSVVFSKLASREADLSNLITNFSVTAGAFAQESTALEQTLAELAPTLEQAKPDLVRFNTTLPPLRAFARELTPGVKELPATIRAGNPWLQQTIRLLQPAELGRVSHLLQGHAADADLGHCFTRADCCRSCRRHSRCFSKVLVPTGDIVINDQFSTGAAELLRLLLRGGDASLASAPTSTATARCSAPRRAAARSSSRPRSPARRAVNSPLWGYTIEPPIGTQPQRPSSRAADPHRRQVPRPTACPNLNGSAALTVGAPSPAAAVSP